MIRRLLLCEYLHADSAAFATASPSLRAEGGRMLSALLTDAAHLPDLDVTTVLCAGAADARNWPGMPTTVVPSADLGDALRAAAGGHDAVFLVAPESDGCLLALCRRLREAGHRLLLPPTDTVRTCSDKLRCAETLSLSGIRVMPTLAGADDAVRLMTDPMVLKPRFGCGGEGIRIVSPGDLASAAAAYSEVVVQPFCEGDWLSIGLIGRGDENHPTILPVAAQQVEWVDGHPVYRGGRIPADLSDHVQQQAVDLATSVAAVLDVTDGYTGIDMLHNRESGQLTVVEVNPRLCTSYVGYRQLTDDNLLSHLLHRSHDDIVWKSFAVEFQV